MPSAPSKARPLRCVSVGDGPSLVLLHGYAMQPETYLPLARLLADRVRVVIPAIFALPAAMPGATAGRGGTLDPGGVSFLNRFKFSGFPWQP